MKRSMCMMDLSPSLPFLLIPALFPLYKLDLS